LALEGRFRKNSKRWKDPKLHKKFFIKNILLPDFGQFGPKSKMLCKFNEI